jgi:hypothetical protein
MGGEVTAGIAGVVAATVGGGTGCSGAPDVHPTENAVAKRSMQTIPAMRERVMRDFMVIHR